MTLRDHTLYGWLLPSTAHLHLEPWWESCSLALLEDVVDGGPKDRQHLEGLVCCASIEDLVDDRVPVKRLVLLHVSSAARSCSQVFKGDLWPHALL